MPKQTIFGLTLLQVFCRFITGTETSFEISGFGYVYKIEGSEVNDREVTWFVTSTFESTEKNFKKCYTGKITISGTEFDGVVGFKRNFMNENGVHRYFITLAFTDEKNFIDLESVGFSLRMKLENRAFVCRVNTNPNELPKTEVDYNIIGHFKSNGVLMVEFGDRVNVKELVEAVIFQRNNSTGRVKFLYLVEKPAKESPEITEHGSLETHKFFAVCPESQGNIVQVDIKVVDEEKSKSLSG